MVRATVVTGLVAGALLVGCGNNPASEVLYAPIDPQADEALKRMSEALGAAPSFSVRATITLDEYEDGQLVQLQQQSTIHLRRPNRLYVETTGDDIDRAVWYDGRRLTVLDRRAGEAASTLCPDTIKPMLDAAVDRYGLTLPAADLLVDDPYEALRPDIISGEYLGLHLVDGRRSHHVAFRQELIDWQIWIDADGPALPRKLLIVYKSEPGLPEYSIVLESWDLSAALGDGLFVFGRASEIEPITMNEMFGLAEGD